MLPALHILDQGFIIAFATLALLAALSDWSRFIIPNWISLGVAGLWALHALLLVVQGHSPDFILWSVGVAFVVFLAGFGMFATGLLGGGDVKLMAAAALWAGPQFVLPFIVIVTVSGALLGLAFLIPGLGNRPEDDPADGAPAGPAAGGIVTAGRLGRKMPYGLAIAVGSVAVTVHLLSAGG